MWDTTDIVLRQEDIEVSNVMFRQDIKGNIKFKECSRLEDLEDGVGLLIGDTEQVQHWVDFKYKIKIMLDKIKTI